jgi:hypothetical protein
MKILAIRLENVRQFDRPVVVEGFGPGLNLLSAPNEHGKSTVFDALQAVFFCPYRTTAKEVKALRPHAGGSPEVALDIAVGEGRFRITKRWLSGAFIRITALDTGTLVAQADEAEAWLDRIAGSAGDGGPAGLLWVRQGVTALDHGSKTEQADQKTARRNLLSSVTGEVESLTGGQRMDRAQDRCRAELGVLVTPTGQPKAGGPYRQALEAVAKLEEEEARLAGLAAQLGKALERRRQIGRDLARLNDPEAEAQRHDRLANATAAEAEAERHTRALEAAIEAESGARVLWESARDRLEQRGKLRAEHDGACNALASADIAADTAGEARTREETRLAEALRADAGAEAAAAAAQDVLNRVQRAETAAEQRDRREELADKLAKAEVQRTTVETATAAAKAAPTAAALRKLDRLAQDIALHRATLDMEGPAVTMRYADDAAGGVTLDGVALPEAERRAIPAGARLDLAGLGQLVVHPGRGTEAAGALEAARAAFDAALAALGFADLAAAEAAGRVGAEAGERARTAAATLAVLAPDGLEALRGRIAALPDPVEPDPTLPPGDVARASFAEAADARKTTSAALARARDGAERARDVATRAVAEQSAARMRLDRATAALPGPQDPDDAALGLALTDCAARHAARAAEREVLSATVPDLEATRASLARAQAVVAGAQEERRTLEAEQMRLATVIDLRAGEAVEETLEDIRQRLTVARAALERIDFEVRVLQRLALALEEARTAARERYFEPVMAELNPLMRLVFDDATLQLDSDAVLPSALVRNRVAENFEVLSGGTREQIALLVRLAFARMLAAGGRATPVILDDALVYTDDDRIERMFDALNREAGDLQIIVLSCRQRAFRELGGTRLTIRPAAMTVPAS